MCRLIAVRLTGTTTTIVTGAVVTATGRTGLDNQLTGPGELRVSSGSFAVDTASMSGAGTTTIAAGASMTVTNAGNSGLLLDDTRTLVDNGTVTLSDQGSGYPTLQFDTSGPTVTVTGTLDLQNGADIGGPGTLTVNTTGTLTKSTGTDQSDVSTSTDNAGTVRSRAGVLNFSACFRANRRRRTASFMADRRTRWTARTVWVEWPSAFSSTSPPTPTVMYDSTKGTISRT